MAPVRKMALVPAELAHTSGGNIHAPSGPVLNQLSLLDQQMKSILDDGSVAPEMKLHQYYNTLRRYETLQGNAARVPVPVTIEEKQIAVPPSAPEAAEPLPVAENELIETVPKTQRQNAKLLLKYIKENPEISWNAQKELLYRGNRVPGSNIFDLVNDTTRNRKNQVPAAGWQEFTEALMSQNIPQGAVGNRQRWQFIRNQQHSPLGVEEEPDSFLSAYSPSPSASGLASARSTAKSKKRKKRQRRLQGSEDEEEEEMATPRITRRQNRQKWDAL